VIKEIKKNYEGYKDVGYKEKRKAYRENMFHFIT